MTIRDEYLPDDAYLPDDDDLSDVPTTEDENTTPAQVISLDDIRRRRGLDTIEDLFGLRFFAPVNEGGKIKQRFLPELLAEEILAMGPLALGDGGLIWAYRGGVWRISNHEIRDRATELLREAYKPDRANAAEHHIQRMLRRDGMIIDCNNPPTDYINFKNGLLNWRTLELAPHTPDIRSTIQLPVNWNPDASCPEFEKFVQSVVPEDVVDTIWELIGYMMMTGNPLHKAVLLIGSGRNGKGTFLRVLTALLGEENVSNVDLHTIASERFGVADLYNRLANIAGDIDAKHLKETARFKQITGEDKIYAEYKGKDGFNFKPFAVPIFSANEIPPSSDSSLGYLSRWLVIKFPYSFRGREDRTLTQRLTTPEELEGIAFQAVLSLKMLMERGDFEMTKSLEEAFKEFHKANDPVLDWLTERCDINPDYPPCPIRRLYEDYKTWCFRNERKALSNRKFYERLESSHGFSRIKSHGVLSYRGIKLLPDDDENTSYGWSPDQPVDIAAALGS